MHYPRQKKSAGPFRGPTTIPQTPLRELKENPGGSPQQKVRPSFAPTNPVSKMFRRFEHCGFKSLNPCFCLTGRAKRGNFNRGGGAKRALRARFASGGAALRAAFGVLKAHSVSTATFL